MLDGGVLGSMALQFHEVHLYLQWCVGEQSDEIGLRCYLQRHEVEHYDTQGANLLTVRPTLVHDEDVLVLQQLYGWQFIWQS